MCDCDIPKRYKKRLLPLNPANDQMPIYNNATGKWELINKADIGGSGTTAFNGNRAIKRSPFVGLNVGGTDVVTFLNNFFFPAVAPVFALTNLGTNYFEKGYISAPEDDPSGNLFAIKGTITVNDGTEVQYRLYDNNAGTAYPNNLAAYTNYTGSIYMGLPFTTNVDKDWRLQLKFKLNGIEQSLVLSGLKSHRFITPYFYGMVNAGTFDLPTTKAALTGAGLTSILSPYGSNVPLTFNGVDKHQIIAYPASYPDLTDIRDPNGFPVLAGWTKITGNVTGFGDGVYLTDPYNYKLYYSPVTTVNSGVFTFKNS